jgi:uncharacterized integral membrane protein
VLAIFATVALVVFVMVNTHHVTLSFVVGGPVRVRMIFLLLTTFFLGMGTAWFTMMALRLRARRRGGSATAPLGTPAWKE